MPPKVKTLEVGDKAPDVIVKNLAGKDIRISDFLGKGKLVLTFYRGYWCCVCYGELDNFRFALPKIREAGGDVISISVDEPKISKEFSARLENHFRNEEMAYELDRKPTDKADRERLEYVLDIARRALAIGDGKMLPFTLLCDPGRKAVHAYSVVDREENIAKPSVFVIDEEGIIRWKHVAKHYFDRPTTGMIIDAIKAVDRPQKIAVKVNTSSRAMKSR